VAKYKFLTLRLHWGEPAGLVRWLVSDRWVSPSAEQERELTVMTGISMRVGPGFAFFGFQYIRDEGGA